MPSLNQRGITLIEVLIVAAIFSIIAAVGLPNLIGALQRNRARGAADTIAVAARDARARAIATGWEFRVFGYNNESGTRPNQYRIEGRANSGVAWPPPATVGPMSTATQMAERWTDLAVEYPGVRLNVGDAGGQCADPLGGGVRTFCVEYGSRGLLNMLSYAGPGSSLQVSDAGGNVARRVSAAVAGAVRVY